MVCSFLCMLALLLLRNPATAGAGQDTVSRIMFGSCLVASRPHPILNTISRMNPDLFVFLGDNIYADTEEPKVMAEKYRELGRSSLFQTLLNTCPVVAIWDDHDYGKNDAGADYIMKETSRQLFLNFWGVPEDSPRRRRLGIYDSMLFGPENRRVQLILLDTRYFRSRLKRNPDWSSKHGLKELTGPYLPIEDEGATILGAEQWKWLAGQLRTPARIRLIASSIQVLAQPNGWESWSNFPLEKARLLRLLGETRAEGVLFISGDRHFAELSVRPLEGFYPLHELTSSGLNIRFPDETPSENAFREGPYYLRENFGMVMIHWDEIDPFIELSIYDEKGSRKISKIVSLSSLKYGIVAEADRPAE